MKTKVLVTGGNGQLGQSIQAIAIQHPTIDFLFVDKFSLDITDPKHVLEFFKANRMNWCINCAAYTNVDKAETEPEQAYQINVLGARNIAQACQKYDVELIHISTDFVFDGLTSTPYKETDVPNPLNVYGKTKLEGELEIASILNNYFIIRTSWLYSEFGHNFMKTMLRLGSERDRLAVVNDQIGSPTYAVDLAEVLLQIISEDKTNYGVFHYSNQGQISWFEFAKTIFELANCGVVLVPILTNDYPALAKRPKYSVLDTSKMAEQFCVDIPYWKDSLAKVFSRVQ